MRQPVQSRVSRATVVSTAAHVLLAVVLISAGSGLGPPSPAPLIIEGTILSGFAPSPAETEERAIKGTPPPSEPPVQAPPSAAPPPPPARPEPAAPVETPLGAAVVAAQTPALPPAHEPASSDLPLAETEAELFAAQPTEPTTDVAAPTDAASAIHGERLAIAEQAMLTKRLESWTGQFTADEPTPTLRWREDGQRYTAVLNRQPATDATGIDHLTVEVTTERDGNRMSTELRMARMAFSSFAGFVDHWNPDVVIHDDEITGRFHSNSEITVSGGRVRPVFHGKVTLAARDFATARERIGASAPTVNRRKMFPGGIETMVRRIALAPGLPSGGAPDGEVQRFENDAAITFYEDGSYGWRMLDGAAPEERRRLTNQPHYLLGADNKVTLRVQGTVNGTVLVYSPGRIVICGNLRYAHDPRSPGAGDLLGLVAERSVEIDEPDVTGPGDLDVYASIYARGEFAVRKFLSDPAGTLSIYGSIAAGSMTASEPRFSTKVVFDTRLTMMRPPGFPLSDRYELESSSGEWHRVPDSTE